jgi:hypothetical protein
VTPRLRAAAAAAAAAKAAFRKRGARVLDDEGESSSPHPEVRTSPKQPLGAIVDLLALRSHKRRELERSGEGGIRTRDGV